MASAMAVLEEYGVYYPKAEMSLRECGLDSLEIAALIKDLEAMYEIEITDEEARNLRTVGDVTAFIEKAG